MPGVLRGKRPAVSIWFHQHLNFVILQPGGDAALMRRYARVAHMRAGHYPQVPGGAPRWENHLLPGTTSFVVELPAGPVGAAALNRHLRAIRAMEAGQRSGSRTSCSA